jgi:hypothetical protein
MKGFDTMTNKRMTKRDYFNTLLAINEVAGNDELVKFIKHEMELLDRKNKSGKMTKTQVENMSLKEHILTVLEKPMTVTEIVKALALNEIGDYTPQKISALMRQLVLDEVVERITDKKRTLFSKVS